MRERTADGLLLCDPPGRREGGPRPVTLSVDYSAFRDAYGGDWASRLSLRRCGSADGPVADVRNDPAPAPCPPGRRPTRPAASSPSPRRRPGPAGDYKATSLSPSGTWQVASQSGAFTWTLPDAGAAGAGRPRTRGGAAYSSGSVDGRDGGHQQPAVLGRGGLRPVARASSSAVQGAAPTTGRQQRPDQDRRPVLGDRQRDPVASASRSELAGRHRRRLATRGRRRHPGRAAHRRRDQRRQRRRVLGGHHDRRHAVLLRAQPAARLDVGQAGDQLGLDRAGLSATTPASRATRPPSPRPRCPQAWRWNLDYVVDPHGNAMSYYYTHETNKYGRNMAATTASYVRGGTLGKIDYGTRRAPSTGGPAPAGRLRRGRPVRRRSELRRRQRDALARRAVGPVLRGRHVHGQVLARRSGHPAALACHHPGPQWRGQYRDVDRWTSPTCSRSLRTRAGPRCGSTVTRHGPECLAGDHAAAGVAFDGLMLPNRVDAVTDGLPALDKWRISAIRTETGGVITVNYSGADCGPGACRRRTPTRRCFPVRWACRRRRSRVNDWFHKYVVTSVDRGRHTGRTRTTWYDVRLRRRRAPGPTTTIRCRRPTGGPGRSRRGFQNVTVTRAIRSDEGRAAVPRPSTATSAACTVTGTARRHQYGQRHRLRTATSLADHGAAGRRRARGSSYDGAAVVEGRDQRPVDRGPTAPQGTSSAALPVEAVHAPDPLALRRLPRSRA